MKKKLYFSLALGLLAALLICAGAMAAAPCTQCASGTFEVKESSEYSCSYKCNSCGTSGSTAHKHKDLACQYCGKHSPCRYSETPTSNGDGTHSKKCTLSGCPWPQPVSEGCEGGTATCNERAVCATCGTAYGSTLSHVFGAWNSNGDGTHIRTCTGNGCTETEDGNCSGGTATCLAKANCKDCGTAYGSMLNHVYGSWSSNGDGTHTRTCVNGCDGTEDGNCSGGTATCTAQAVCKDCNTGYGAVSTGHEYKKKVVEPACTSRGYTKYSCTACGDSYKANYKSKLMHWFDLWTPNGDGTHSAPCKREDCDHTGRNSCTAYEVTVNETIMTVCPVCGEFGDTAFAVVEDAAVDGRVLPAGEKIVRGMAAPFDGALYAFTAAYEYSGKVQAFSANVNVSMPVELQEAFKLVRVDVTPATETTARTELWTEVPFAWENGVLSFEAETAALYLLVAAE